MISTRWLAIRGVHRTARPTTFGLATCPSRYARWFGGGRRAETDYVIRGGDIAGVSHGLVGVGGIENGRTRPHANPLVAHERFDGSLLHDDDLIVRALENYVVRGAGIQCGGVTLQIFETGGGAFEN